ncbi:MAG: hypothetical protein IPK33_23635 [Gemmatimonadetes bacterium]|nr:hypothetical protein [Gemmatimonadota bacterium]
MPQRVRLTTTDAYFSNAAPPPAAGAAVRVTDDVGTTLTYAASPNERASTCPPVRGPVRRRYTPARHLGGRTV